MSILLFVKESSVKEIVSRNTTSSEKIIELIRVWRNSNTGDLDTIEQELIKGFREIERSDIADILHNACIEKRSLRKRDF